MPKTIRNKGIQGGFEIFGIQEISKILSDVLPREAENLMRSTMDGIASEIRKKAAANARNRGLRTIAKAIKSRRKKSPPRKPVSLVFVEHGRQAKHDAYFWHFFEYGTDLRVIQTGKYAGRAVGRIQEQPYIRPAKDAIISNIDNITKEQFNKKLSSRIKAVQKKAAFR